jgi:DNA-binding cell septation regulator SpoVG
MIKLRDHYFIAWLKVVKDKEIIINDDGVFVNVASSVFKDIQEEYNKTAKPVFKEVRKLVKQLSASANKPAKS